MIAFNCTVALAISFPMFLKQKLVKWENFCGKFCTEDWGVDAHMRSVYGRTLLHLTDKKKFSILIRIKIEASNYDELFY